MQRHPGTVHSSAVNRGRIKRRLLAALTASILFTATAAADPVKQSSGSFTCGGKAIAVEHFEPAEGGRHPAVLLLHGSDGLKQNGLVYRTAAQTLAREGYVALLVHYFDRTGTTKVAPDAIARDDFLAWVEAVREAVKYVSKLPRVDGGRIGLLGISLGAYVALTVAARNDVAIAAIADWFGGLPAGLRANVKGLPPTLIVHGGGDKTVPVREAHSLEALLKQEKIPHEIKIYSKQGHLFCTDPLGPDATDARQRTLSFFAKYVKKAEPRLAAKPSGATVEQAAKRDR
jgi:carboxymethylenebutenolidase